MEIVLIVIIIVFPIVAMYRVNKLEERIQKVEEKFNFLNKEP